MEDRQGNWKNTRSPKRLSGYQLLLKECLQELKTRNPGCSMVLPVVSKLCAERWQRLDEKTKNIFQEEADKINGSPKSKTKAAKRQLPKRPLSAFILFCKDNRNVAKKNHPGASMVQISTVLSGMWTAAEPELKQKYQQLSKNQRDQYKKELEEAKDAEEGAPLEEMELEGNDD